MILEVLPFSFRMAKRTLKDYRVFIWKSPVLQVLLSRKEEQYKIRKVQEKE